MSMSAPGQLNLSPSEFVGSTIDVMEPSMQGLNYHPNGYPNNHEQIHSLPGYNMSHHQLSRPKQYNMGEIYSTQLHQAQSPAGQYNIDYATGNKAMSVPVASPNMEYQSYMSQNTQQIHKDMNVYIHPQNPLVCTNQSKAQYTEAPQEYQAHALPFNGQSSKRYSQESGQSDFSKGHSRTSSSNTSTADYPEPAKPKIATTYWEDEKTLCYQVKARGILVSRREDTDFINGTKLLNVIGMTRGKRDGILKTEKVRTVVKVGSMNLKGVWIPFERAYEFARNEGLDVVLYPLFVKNISEYYNSVGHRLKTDNTTFDDLEVDTAMTQ